MDLNIVTDFIANRFTFTQDDLYIGYFLAGIIWSLLTEDWQRWEDEESSGFLKGTLWLAFLWPLFFVYTTLRVVLSPLRDSFYRWKLEHEYLDYKNGKTDATTFYKHTDYGQLLHHKQQAALMKKKMELDEGVEKLKSIFEEQVRSSNPSRGAVENARTKIEYAKDCARSIRVSTRNYKERESYVDHFDLKDVVRYNAFRRKTVDVYTQGSDEHEVMSWIELVNFTNG